MSTDPLSQSYYRRRAAKARALAVAATLQGVRKIHLDMASAYESKAEEAEAALPRPTLRLSF